MKVQKALAAALATATLAAVAMTGGNAAFAENVTPDATVDLGQSNCPANSLNTDCTVGHGSTGFLYGQATDGVPSDTTLQGLGVLDTTVAKPPQGIQHPNGDVMDITEQWKRNGGKDIQIYMKDAYAGFPYPAYGSEGIQEFVTMSKNQVKTVLDEFPQYESSFVWIPFNEPDYNDKNYPSLTSNTDSQKKFFEDWDTIYHAIKSVDPNARIGGPNWARYVNDFYSKFLQHAKDNGTVPDVITWHQLEKNWDKYYSDYDAWRTTETKIMGADSKIPVNINEYAWYGEGGGVTEQTQPGRLLQYITRFEYTGIGGALPYWFPAGDLDLLVSHNNQVTGTWWLYNWYGKMSGQLAKVDFKNGRNQRPQVLASYDETSRQTRMLFGGSGNTTFDMTIALAGLQAKYPEGAHVTVYGVDEEAAGNVGNYKDDSGASAGASDGPYVVSDGVLTTGEDTATLTFNQLKGRSAYYAVITPGTGLAVAAQIGQTVAVDEAEYETLSGTSQAVYAADGNDGAGYVQGTDATAATDFFITSTKDGYYDLALRYAAPKGEGTAAQRAVTLKLNREDAVTLQLPETEDASTWETATVRVYLPLGINQVTVAGYGASDVRIDSLGFTQASDEGVVRYEAENATLSGSANKVNLSSASNGVIVGNVGQGAGNAVTFTNVNAEEEGNYTLTISYAHNEYTDSNAYQTVERWADLKVNGGEARSIVFANTRDWNEYWTTSVRVHLNKGANTLSLSNSGTGSASNSGKRSGWAPNFDYIQVARTAVDEQYPAPAGLYTYFVDAGARNGAATSAAYQAAVNAAKDAGAPLLNDKADQQQNGKKWGASTTVKTGTVEDAADTTVLKATGKSIGYRFTLEAGTYTLKAALGSQGDGATLDQKVSWKGGSAAGQAVTVTAGEVKPGTVEFTLDKKTTITYTVTRTTGTNPTISWISVR